MNYVRPASLDETCTLLEDQQATLLAGGTDLLPRFEQGRPLPRLLVDIKHIPELSAIRSADDSSLEIGSLVTVDTLLHDERVQSTNPALSQAAHEFAAVQIRHRATIGGNICNASPAGDLLPPLYAAGASVKVVGVSGERILPISEAVTGPGKTSLKPGEILKSVLLPGTGASSRFVKLGLRDAMAISVVNFAINYRVEDGGFAMLEIAAGAVGPTVKLLRAYTDAVLRDTANISRALDLVDQAISPIDDIRATAAYRSRVLKSLLEHTLLEVLGRSDD